jgi:hypothetical protein
MRPYNAGYLVKYPFFARILAPCRANNSTSPTLHRCALECKEGLCKVGLVELLARHGANIRAKSLIVSEKKTTVINAHLCSETATFGPLNATPAVSVDLILKTSMDNSILFKQSNYHPQN